MCKNNIIYDVSIFWMKIISLKKNHAIIFGNFRNIHAYVYIAVIIISIVISLFFTSTERLTVAFWMRTIRWAMIRRRRQYSAFVVFCQGSLNKLKYITILK